MARLTDHLEQHHLGSGVDEVVLISRRDRRPRQLQH